MDLEKIELKNGRKMNLKLVKPSLKFKEKHYEYIRKWEISKEEMVPYSMELLNQDFETWLDNTYKIEKEETCLPNLVPAETYYLTDEKENILGAINIRHKLNDYLFNYGGHIGYGILPSERKKGYATKMLKLALIKAKQMNISKILITCDKTNTASAKTIISNGGVLENEVSEKNIMVQRYWIVLR